MDNGRENRRPGKAQIRDNDGKEQEVKICISALTKILNKVILIMKGLGSLAKCLAQRKSLIKLALSLLLLLL